MTELHFQKLISNNKNERIFHFCAITNIFNNSISCSQRFDGDVIVNLTTGNTYISKRALASLKNDCRETVKKVFTEKLKELNHDETRKFMDMKCEEMVKLELFEECEKLEKVMN